MSAEAVGFKQATDALALPLESSAPYCHSCGGLVRDGLRTAPTVARPHMDVYEYFPDADFFREHWQVREWRHACAILKTDFPQEWEDITEALTEFRLRTHQIIVGGGRKSLVAEAIDSALLDPSRGWEERKFDTHVVVDGNDRASPTHKVDCYKNHVGLEVEWNNKDPFFDRDLNNFRLLFDLRVLSVGVIVTRKDELQDIFEGLGRGASYGASTTHMGRLIPRIEGGGGGGCPILVFGISKALYVEETKDEAEAALERYRRGKDEEREALRRSREQDRDARRRQQPVPRGLRRAR